MDTLPFMKNSSLPPPKLEETSAFTKFLKQNVENSRLLSRFPPQSEDDAASSESTKFSTKVDHKSPFCIESLLKSDGQQQPRSSPDRFPPLSPPSDSSPPPPSAAFPGPPLAQFPFPPQLLPYLLPSPSQAPDYIQMEYLARQGVFLNSFPAFAGTESKLSI